MGIREVIFLLEAGIIDTLGGDDEMNVRSDTVKQPYFFMPTDEYYMIRWILPIIHRYYDICFLSGRLNVLHYKMRIDQ